MMDGGTISTLRPVTRRRHELRDDKGEIVAVVDAIGTLQGMVELACDTPSGGVRVRIFPPAENN